MQRRIAIVAPEMFRPILLLADLTRLVLLVESRGRRQALVFSRPRLG
jgi:hypothetical protein